jgi:hypothetical protein
MVDREEKRRERMTLGQTMTAGHNEWVALTRWWNSTSKPLAHWSMGHRRYGMFYFRWLKRRDDRVQSSFVQKHYATMAELNELPVRKTSTDSAT